MLLKTALAGRLNDGPHGLTEMVYAYTSATNNNGSAFAGLTVTSQWYQTHARRSACSSAGSSSSSRRWPSPARWCASRRCRSPSGTFPTDTPLFGGLVLGVIVIVAGLTFFPVLALGPIVEHLSL